ncbi:MAG: hypothetical protein MK033_10450 [Candidatus Caenarcaniphilales bacterium]|nr:hypothetical protein [Candidatus Caenarcaniphilales bacterium]
MTTQSLLTTHELEEINKQIASSLDEPSLQTLKINAENLVKSQVAEKALKIGDSVPDFTLKNSRDKDFNFYDLLAKS